MAQLESTDVALRDAMAAALGEIEQFVNTAEFQEVLRRLYGLPPQERPAFVSSVLVSKEGLRNSGVEVPEGMVVQRSFFGDQRPTLFCVTKKLPAGNSWEKVTFTFENE